MEKCLEVFCEGSLEEAFGAFIDLGAESNHRFVSLDHRWALGRAGYGGPAPLLEEWFFALLGVVRMRRSSSTLCCKLSTKVQIVFWRPFASLTTCLRDVADHHGSPRLQWTKGGGRLGYEGEATWPRNRQDGRRGD